METTKEGTQTMKGLNSKKLLLNVEKKKAALRKMEEHRRTLLNQPNKTTKK